MGPEYRHAARAHKQPTDLLAPNVGAAPEPRHRFDAGVGAGRPRAAWSVASGDHRGRDLPDPAAAGAGWDGRGLGGHAPAPAGQAGGGQGVAVRDDRSAEAAALDPGEEAAHADGGADRVGRREDRRADQQLSAHLQTSWGSTSVRSWATPATTCEAAAAHTRATCSDQRR